MNEYKICQFLKFYLENNHLEFLIIFLTVSFFNFSFSGWYDVWKNSLMFFFSAFIVTLHRINLMWLVWCFELIIAFLLYFILFYFFVLFSYLPLFALIHTKKSLLTSCSVFRGFKFPFIFFCAQTFGQPTLPTRWNVSTCMNAHTPCNIKPHACTQNTSRKTIMQTHTILRQLSQQWASNKQ